MRREERRRRGSFRLETQKIVEPCVSDAQTNSDHVPIPGSPCEERGVWPPVSLHLGERQHPTNGVVISAKERYSTVTGTVTV